MKKKFKIRIWILVGVIIFSIFLGCFFWLRSNSNKNSLGKKLERLMKEPEIKKTLFSHSRRANLEKIKPDNEKSELTVKYGGSFFVENSEETFVTFRPTNCQEVTGIAVASENPILSGKGLKFDAKLKFKISYFCRDVQKHWGAGRKTTGGYWGDYHYFDSNNTNFQLESLPYQWENSQSLNPDFLGKWKIDLPKSIESGFAKINSKIRRRIQEQLSRDCYTNAAKQGDKSLEIEIKEENGLVRISWNYTIFWLKNLNDYSMVCFTDYHPNHSFDILEDGCSFNSF